MDDPLPPGLALAWGGQPVHRRGPKPAFAVRDVVTAAIELADADGVPALSLWFDEISVWFSQFLVSGVRPTLCRGVPARAPATHRCAGRRQSLAPGPAAIIEPVA